MKILVLRHGRTTLNEKGFFNGQFDEPLNERGREDAAGAREKLQDVKIDRVYCSPLLRTRETCEIAVGGRGLTVDFDKRLMERTMGVLDGRDVSMSGFEYGRMFDYDYALDLPGGFENWGQVFARVGDFLDEIIPKYLSSDATVLLVTHGGVARVIYYHFYPLPEDRNILEPKMNNCDVAEFAIENLGEGRYRAELTRIF